MFDIGWSELLVIGVVAIIVVGPKDLPKLMRGIGFYAGKLRRAASDFRRQFDQAMHEAELDEVRKSIESVQAGTSSLDLKATVDQPIMVANPDAKAGGKQAAKRPRKRTASKPKDSAKRAKTGRTRRS